MGSFFKNMRDLNINDVKRSAEHYRDHFLNKRITIKTYSGVTIILVPKAHNFCHLVGIKKADCIAAHIRPESVFTILTNQTAPSFPQALIPSVIRVNSLKWKKIVSFEEFSKDFFDSISNLCILFNDSLSASALHCDYLISNYDSGFSSGWSLNRLSNEYEPVTWINESNRNQIQKEKYYANQVFDLISSVEITDVTNNVVLDKKRIKRRIKNWKNIKKVSKRNNMSLKLNRKSYFKRMVMALFGIKVVLS